MILLAALLAMQTQMDMGRQADSDFARADKAMNLQYRATMAHMKAMDAYPAPDAKGQMGYQAALLASQRAWLAFRDAECRIEGYEFRGGSAQPMAVGQCLARLTVERSKQLKMMVQPQ